MPRHLRSKTKKQARRHRRQTHRRGGSTPGNNNERKQKETRILSMREELKTYRDQLDELDQEIETRLAEVRKTRENQPPSNPVPPMESKYDVENNPVNPTTSSTASSSNENKSKSDVQPISVQIENPLNVNPSMMNVSNKGKQNVPVNQSISNVNPSMMNKSNKEPQNLSVNQSNEIVDKSLEGFRVNSGEDED